MLSLALMALLVLVFVEHRIAPAPPRGWSITHRVIATLQWILLPIVGVLFSNLPALDAQTRLLTGRYLEYRVTEKA
jgi:hypothetical protein